MFVKHTVCVRTPFEFTAYSKVVLHLDDMPSYQDGFPSNSKNVSSCEVVFTFLCVRLTGSFGQIKNETLYKYLVYTKHIHLIPLR